MRYGRVREVMSRRDQGFTLIELLVVIIVIGILAAIAVPVYSKQRDKAAKAVTKTHLREIMPDVITARENVGGPLWVVTGSLSSEVKCRDQDGYVIYQVKDPRFGVAPDDCGIAWLNVTAKIAQHAGHSNPDSVRKLLTDGWGYPILVDENESTGPLCTTPWAEQFRSAGPNHRYAESPFLDDIFLEIPPSGFC